MPMRSDPVPTDLLHIRDAAALAGKSVDTVRRWRGAHGLRDYRDTRAPSSPSLFSRSDLMTLVAGLSAPHDLAVIDGVLAGSAGGLPRPVTTSPGGALVHVMVEDLRTQRDRAQAELEGERTRAQVAVDALDAARAQTLDLAVRLARLETLVATGGKNALNGERARLLGRTKKKKRG